MASQNPVHLAADDRVGRFEASQIAGISPEQFRRLTNAGLIACEWVCGRRTYRRADVERFTDQRRAQLAAGVNERAPRPDQR